MCAHGRSKHECKECPCTHEKIRGECEECCAKMKRRKTSDKAPA